MLRRLGKKSKLLPKLLPLFPENITTFIDMFMGSGAVTFAMVDRSHSIIANDNDGEVVNLFLMMKEHKQELFKLLEIMPQHQELFQYWKSNTENDNLWKAARFVMLSNFGYLGKPDVLSFTFEKCYNRQNILNGIENIFLSINDVSFMNEDFRNVLPLIGFNTKRPMQRNNSFIYADPPYLETGNNYAESFTEDDTRDLFSILTSSGIRFALSEFRHSVVMDLAKEHGLYVTSLGERRNLKNRREEILITNYHPERAQGELF